MTGAYCANCGEDLDDKLEEIFKIYKKIKGGDNMGKIDLNQMAKKITLAEGLKKSVSIGQVKEIMSLVFETVSKMSIEDVANIMARYKGRK